MENSAAANQSMRKDCDVDIDANRGEIDAPENTKNEGDNDATTTLPMQKEKRAKQARKLRKKRSQSRLSTLRVKLFAKPGFLTTEGRKTILNLAITIVHRG